MFPALRTTTLVATAILVISPTTTLAEIIDGPDVEPRPISEVVRSSKIIFGGTVAQVKRGRDQRVGEFTRVTFKDVAFVKGAMPGNVALTLPVNRDASVLVRKGGSVISVAPRPVTKAEAAGSFLNGLPVFHQGSRYVVLAAEWGNPEDGFLPIIREDGFFMVLQEGATGSFVLDSEKRPVVGVEDGCLGVVDSTFGVRDEGTVRVVPVDNDGRVRDVYPDSVFTSSHVVSGDDNLPALRIYPTRADTAKRLTEAAFLDALRRIKLKMDH